MPVKWLDVGSWPQLSETLEMDAHNNAVDAERLVAIDSDDNIVVCRDANHIVALIGVSDMVVVHTADATLVCPKSESQRVKEVVTQIKEKFGSRHV
jgi:mannose-1-phosphate guanylyltransferase